MARHETPVTTESTAASPPLVAAAGADVFVSYARANRPTAEQIAAALVAQSFSVWWDRELLAGSEFSEAIEAQLLNARAVLVLWSSDSVRSGFVRDESARALRVGKLLPVRIDDVELPLGFGQIHTLDLIGWDGDTDDPAFVRLVHELRLLQGGAAHGGSAAEARPVSRRATRRVVLALGAVVLVVALGVGGKFVAERSEQRRKAESAEQQFLFALERQDAKEPQLDLAFNAFVTAVQLNPRHARARYYLGHLHAQKGRDALALEAFRLALAASDSPLEASQRAIAEEQDRLLTAKLAAGAKEAPITRAADAAPAAPSTTLPAVVAAAPDEPTPAAARPIVGAPPAMPTPRSPAALPPQEPADRTARPTPSPLVIGQGAAPPLSATAAGRRMPVPVGAPEATLSRLAGMVESMFAEDKDTRIDATTRLIVDAEALSDAVPLAVVAAQRALRDAGMTPSAAKSSGVVNTLVLLQSALPATLQLQREPIEQLLASARRVGETTRQHADKVAALLQQAPRRRPLAYLQIANEAQRPLAEALRGRLRDFGYDAPAIEVVGARAPERTEVRVQGRSDRGLARWVARAAGQIGGAEPKLATLRSANPKADTYEIWFERELCVPGGRSSPGCGG